MSKVQEVGALGVDCHDSERKVENYKLIISDNRSWDNALQFDFECTVIFESFQSPYMQKYLCNFQIVKRPKAFFSLSRS
jgi:hypothetical protein